MPLAKCACEEDRSQGDGQKPPHREGTHFPTPQQLQRIVDRQTAGKQADGEEDRNTEDILRLGSGNALADVKHVGDDEDREDRGLGGNQAVHGDRSSGWRIPSEIISRDGDRPCAHELTRIPNQDLPDASGPTAGGGCGPREWPRSCTPAAAKGWTIRASMRPRDRSRRPDPAGTTTAGWQGTPVPPRPERTRLWSQSGSIRPSPGQAHRYRFAGASPKYRGYA